MGLLAIHHRKGTFSDRWIAYCERQALPYRIVNCFDSDIIREVSSADALLWHWVHTEPREQLIARQVILALMATDLVVFPSPATCWHFDDKLAQKYLLEAIGAPLIPSYVFYEPAEALRWIEEASFPKVFKLRKGAGSTNVRLIRTAHEARALVKRAFSGGFRPFGYGRDVFKRYRAARLRGDLMGAFKRMPKMCAEIQRINRAIGPEKGYIYFQDFISNNQFDTRVTIIGNRAFAFTRNVRPGDFRASGSGDIVYEIERIHPLCVQIAFEVTRKLGSQSLAFDFVLADNKQPMIAEISYCYASEPVYNCPGQWDNHLRWHAGHIWPEDAILMDVLDDVARRRCGRDPTQTLNDVTDIRTAE
jgi:glutathione synthase/RimK-type ligase-like ATP-grasp enzyme